MRISGNEGIKGAEPARSVDRVSADPGVLSVFESGQNSGAPRQPVSRRGFVLRQGDKRRNPGRGALPVNRRSARPRLNVQTHDVVIMAIEKVPGMAMEWSEGQAVVVQSVPGGRNAQAKAIKTAPEDNADYVLHLSPPR